MSTFDRQAPRLNFPGWRTRVDRLLQAAMARRPAVRWGLLLAASLVLAGAGYLATIALVPGGTRYLASGRSFSSEDLIKICKSLDAQGITYRIDGRKVEVLAADQFDLATAAFSKLDVGPLPFDELRDAADSWTIWDLSTREEREQRDKIRHEKMIARFIDDLDGVVWSLVAIQRPRTTLRRYAHTRPSAFVYLETESDRRLPPRIIEMITTILVSNEPELSHDSITVMDRRGWQYLDPRRPELGNLSRNRAREEQLREDIREKLDWIRGVQVWVDLVDRRDAGGAPAPAAEPAERSPAESPVSIGVNEPLGLAEPAAPVASSGHPAPPAPGDFVESGRVLVSVPRSFYYHAFRTGADLREPSPDERQALVALTRSQIVRRVNLVVPESWTVDVDTIPDEIPVGGPASHPSGSDWRRRIPEWGIGAAIAAGLAILTALASWIQVARRPPPARPPAAGSAGRRFRAESAGESSPSERVRELVRSDPEAAASVLQRWTTQGGPGS